MAQHRRAPQVVALRDRTLDFFDEGEGSAHEPHDVLFRRAGDPARQRLLTAGSDNWHGNFSNWLSNEAGRHFSPIFIDFRNGILPKRSYDLIGMSIVSSIAVSGINAASLRLRVAAENIANARTSGYVPKEVVQVDTGQGTAATVRPVSSDGTAAYDSAGLSGDRVSFGADPYLRLTNEIVQVLVARFDLSANAQVLRADARTAAALYSRSF
jgi:flagellar basal-body rod protein FlgC